MDDTFVIFNPRSGKGRGARLVEPVLRALRVALPAARIEHALTAAAGDEGRLAGEAAGRGFARIVAVGGDGTWGNVGNALIGSGTNAALGLVPGGTGCDLAKSLGIPARDLHACARIIAQGHVRAIDAGTVEDRFFLNVVGFGFDIAVIEHSWRVRYLSGSLLYLYCALRQLHSFPGFPVEMATEGGGWQRQEMLMLVFSNGQVFGGGFQIAPKASLSDGRLDAVAFSNMPWKRRLPLMVRLLRGTHGEAREVATFRGASFRLRFQAPPAYETDGEWSRARSAELEIGIRPAALRVLVPAPA